MPASPIKTIAPTVVLDTNVVLDWLVFQHPTCESWAGHFSSAGVRWLASQAMRDELAHVLGRDVVGRWQPDLARLWEMWNRFAQPAEELAPYAVASRVRCTDSDDQKFIDLALTRGARWLVSRDRAVRKLAGRVRPLGLEILLPEQWTDQLARELTE